MSGLKLIRERREKWLACYEGKDSNTVWNQVTHMVWDAAVFRSVNEAIRIAPKEKTGGVKLNGAMFGLLQRCFFREQAVTIRRISDSSSTIDDEKRGTFSLGTLLKDISAHRELLTRKVLFELEGVEYDTEKMERLETEYYEQHKHEDPNGVIFIPDSVCPHDSERRHEAFDILSGKNPATRSPDDVILEDVLKFLTERLANACQPIKGHADKHIAHAATPENRAKANAQNGISLQMLNDAYKVILQTCSIVGVDILGRNGQGGVAIAADKFMYIDRPLIDKADIPKIETVWNDFQEKVQGWDSWLASDLKEEMDAHKVQVKP